MTWRTGVKYEGEFANGMANGRGVKTWPHSKVFYDKADYSSQNVWPSGTKFIGAQQSKRRSKNKYEQSGATYIGQFVNDKAEGAGEFTWPDGRKYTGDFYNNRANG
jgi:hypothetical protein